MKPKVICGLEKRLKRRSIDEEELATEAKKLAERTNDWAAMVDHGGEVEWDWRRPNAQHYSECALAISDPDGLTLVIIGSINASSGVTCRKIAERLVPGSEDLWDRRVKKPARKSRALEVLKQYHTDNFSAMEKLAAAAD